MAEEKEEDLQVQIEKAINSTLPKQVGDVLQKRLKKADELESENLRLQKTIDKLEKEKVSLQDTITEHEKLELTSKKLDEREKELDTKQRNQEVSILKIQLEEANKRADLVGSYTQGLVRNTVFRSHILDSENGPSGQLDQYGNQVFRNTSKSYTETKEEQ